MNKRDTEKLQALIKKYSAPVLIKQIDSMGLKYKRCPACEEVKHESEYYKRDFHKNSKGELKYYLSGYCRPCFSKIANKKE